MRNQFVCNLFKLWILVVLCAATTTTFAQDWLGFRTTTGFGNGNGTFAAQVTYDAGTGPFSVTTLDFNGDGVTDLATANSSSNSISLLRGNDSLLGDGTFTTLSSTYAVGDGPVSVTTGDFNGDGITDLATANSASNNVSVLLNNPDGNSLPAGGRFLPQLTFDVGDSPFGVATGDFNNDGFIDVTTANQDSNSISVLLNQGLFDDDATSDAWLFN